MTARFFFLLCCIFFLSCSRKQPVTELQNTPLAVEALTSDSSAVDTSRVLVRGETAIAVSTSQSEIIRILPTGTFHGDEVEEGADALSWLGLFTGEDGDFVLKQTKITATRVVDGLLDDEEKGEMTGWEINTESGEYPTILISGGGLTEGKVEVADIPSSLYPGDSAQFVFKGNHYLLYATGSTEFDSTRGTSYVSDYNLYIVLKHNGNDRTSLLVSHADFDEAMTSIQWSGDLDRDGYIDFLIDLSRHYNVRQPTLFLSKPAEPADVVVPVAEHSSVGC